MPAKIFFLLDFLLTMGNVSPYLVYTPMTHSPAMSSIATVRGPADMSFILGDLDLSLEDAAEIANAWKHRTKTLSYQSTQNLYDERDNLLVAANTAITADKASELLQSSALATLDNTSTLCDQIRNAMLVHQLIALYSAVLSFEQPDFAPLIFLIKRCISELPSENRLFEWLVDLRNCVITEDEALRKLGVSTLRAAYLAACLGRRTGLTTEGLQDVFATALFADLGMLFIHPDTLEKKILTQNDFRQVRTHPIISQRILAESSSFSPYIMSGVLHHHRNLDGTGYPEDEDEPNDYARIANIVSTYTAMRWRSLPTRQILRALILSSRSLESTGGPSAKCDPTYVDALNVMHMEDELLEKEKRQMTASVNTIQGYQFEIFEDRDSLAAYLSKIIEISSILSTAYAHLSKFFHTGRQSDPELKEFMKAFDHLTMLPRVLRISENTNFDTHLSNTDTLGEIEHDALSVYREMMRARTAVNRPLDTLRDRYVDASFRRVRSTYSAAIHELKDIKSFMKKGVDTEAQ
ncbi:MAG TPA: hypothetical protein ENI80_05135 [Acidiferrobacteraceae bacterium]|nr:hypothetical protein [Acidiferrobacteraceae bacterium]